MAAQKERDLAAARQPETALDFYLVGDELYRQGQSAQAIRPFDRTLELQRGHFWAYRVAGRGPRWRQFTPHDSVSGAPGILKRQREFLNSPLDFAWLHCGETQLQSFPIRSSASVPAERHHLHIALGCGPCSRFAADPAAQPAHRLQSSLDTRNIKQSR